LAQVLSSVSDLLESAAAMTDVDTAREHMESGLEALREKLNIPAFNGSMSDGTILLSTVLLAHLTNHKETVKCAFNCYQT